MLSAHRGGRALLRRLVATTVLAGGLTAVGIAAPAQAALPPVSASYTSTIAIPASGTGSSGPANPYASSVSIAGLPAGSTVGDVSLTLTNLSHTWYNDLDMMLVGPSGTNLVFYNRMGGSGTGTTARTFSFHDGAPTMSGTPPTSGGTYAPRRGSGGTFPAPAPAASSATTFAGAFNGTAANGTWQLYIHDSANGDIGSLGGWTLTVTAATTPQTIAFPAFPNQVRVGDTLPLSATGGGSGNPVTFAVAPTTTHDACRITDGGTAVVFRESGTCAITAEQAGNDQYDPASLTRSTNVVAALPPTATLGISPQGASTTAGSGVAYTVVARDANDVVIPDQVSTVSYARSGGGSTVCPSGVCTPTSAGTYTVTATAPGANGPVTTSTTLTVLASGVAALSISPEDETVAAGAPITFAVAGTDQYGNPLPDQTAASTVVATPLGGGPAVTCPAGVCTLTQAGTWSVAASQSGTGAPAGDATTLTVTPAAADSIEVSPASRTITAGDAQQYVVTSADEFGNARPDRTYDATVTATGPATVACPHARCAPTKAGTYTVTATDGALTSTATLTVQAGDLAKLDVTPDIATTRVDVPLTYAATGADAFGNDLGEVTPDVAFAYAPVDGGASVACASASCSVPQAGTYVVTGSLGAAADKAALNVTESTTTLAIDPLGPTTFGQAVPLAVTVTGADGVPTGHVQFSVDGTAVGSPVAVPADGKVTGPVLEHPGAGLHRVRAAFTPSSAPGAPASVESSFVVAKASTTASLTVTADDLSATVSGPHGTTPGGTVTFAIDGQDVGTAELVDGTATLPGATTGKSSSVVTATYGGSADFEPSAASTARRDPKVTASVTGGPTTGWSRTPVTVSFSCEAGSAPVVTCPGPVVISTEGAGQTVTRTVKAQDGGVAVVTSTPVNIDLTGPVAAVRRVADGRAYNGQAASPTCAAHDALSGLASCDVTTTGGSPGRLVTTVTATDVAGNTTTAVARYQVRDTWVSRATVVGSAWSLPKGSRRTFHVITEGQPTFVNPMTGERVRGTYAKNVDGKGHWVARLRVPASAKVGRTYVVKVLLDGGSSRKVRVRVER